MNHWCRLLILSAFVSLAAAPAYSQSSAKGGYDNFITVKTRNIFDPSRRPVRIDEPKEKSRDRERRQSYFSLTGTMVAEGRSLAFFSGSRSEFSKVLPVGETIGGYKVTAITPLQIEVEREGKPLVMAVGHRLELQGLTDEVSASEVASSNNNNNNNSGSNNNGSGNNNPGASAPPPTSPSAYADKAEIMRRMMERAQAERK